MASKDAKDYETAVKLFEQCTEGYLHSGSMDTAAMTIDKSAKMMELIDPIYAIKVILAIQFFKEYFSSMRKGWYWFNRLIDLAWLWISLID